jgi:L-ribulose-5-phosphate 3-epimerase
VQGRLLRPPRGLLQWFPQEQWPMEYYIAPAVGIDFIELIAERQHNEQNPMWSDAGIAQIHEHAAANGLIVPTFTNDYIIDHPIVGDADVMRLNVRLIEQGAKLGCTKYVFPLFERSEMTAANARDFVSVLRETADACAAHGIQLCLETVVEGEAMLEVLASFDRPDIGLVFDTGNRAALGHDLARDIRLFGASIAHVHIKDKSATNENVALGTGLVNFAEVFSALADVAYAGMYTFETSRGEHPLRTAAFNIGLATHFHREAFGR